MTENTFSSISFPLADSLAQSQPREVKEIEKLLGQCASLWMRAIEALLPMRAVRVSLTSLRALPYSEFVESKSEAFDYQVFELQALESLCVWGMDPRLVSVAVDCLFGGQGKLPVRGLGPRLWTPIEQRIRQRIWESLANAYETPWQDVVPQRLKALRQEVHAKNLRIAQPENGVYAADFLLELNDAKFDVTFCLPVSQQLQHLWLDGDAESAPQEAVWGRELRQQLRQAPLEATAILATKTLTLGQLLELKVGQVLPIDLSKEIDVEIEGRSMLSGRYGVKNNKYAVKVESVLDALDQLLDRQQMLHEESPQAAPNGSGSAVMVDPLQSVAEAFNGFDQQVALGGRDGKV